jgi:AraC-like DNA-binding protein
VASTEKGTIAICFVEKALHEVRRRGLNADALLDRAGISAALLSFTQARVSVASYGTLWRLVNIALDEEFFGEDSRPMKNGSFAMVCHGVIHCTTLGQALRRTLRFFSVLLDDLHGTVHEEGSQAWLTLNVRPGTPVRPFAHETFLMMVHGLMCWLAGRRIPIDLACFAYAEPPYSAEYRTMYSPRLEFGRAHTALAFDAASLRLPVIQNDKTLKSFLRAAPEGILVKYRNRQGMAARIRQRLKKMPLAQWPTFDTLAAQLHVSDSTLRRRLNEEGQTYQVIKDDLRRDLAIDLLSHTARSLADIAADLGFAEPSAFHRAFRKWTGARPAAYRQGD